MRTGLVLAALLLAPLCGGVSVIALVLGRPELVLPSIAYFTAWQLHEGFRRGLFCSLRHREAIAGDAVCYLGQAAVVLIMALSHTLSLGSALLGMAGVALIAMLLQAQRLALPLQGPIFMRATAYDFASIGCWSLLNNIIGAIRGIPLLWILAFSYGTGSAASLQSLINVINLVNPLLIGLTNVLPQITARSRGGHPRASWDAARPYVAVGAPLVLGFALLLLVAPGEVLALVYGRTSPYADLGPELRLMTTTLICGYWVEMVCAILHGIDKPEGALAINVVGAVTSLGLAIPLTIAFGLIGTCSAMAIGAIARLATSQLAMNRVVFHESCSNS
jgi:hypothetical protein